MRKAILLFVFAAFAMLFTVTVPVQAQGPKVHHRAKVSAATHFDTSAPLTELHIPKHTNSKPAYPAKPIPRNYQSGRHKDPVRQRSAPQLALPATSLNFDGVGSGFSGPQGTFSVSSAPPDTDGDVGPNHYVQIVNSDFAIFNKSGTPIYGPVPTNT